MQTCGVRCNDRPVFVGLFTHATSGQSDGRGWAGIQMGFGVFGHEERGEEADHACLLHVLEGGIGERHDGQFFPSGEDDVVEIVAALGVEVLDVGFDRGGGEVAGVTVYATFG